MATVTAIHFFPSAKPFDPYAKPFDPHAKPFDPHAKPFDSHAKSLGWFLLNLRLAGMYDSRFPASEALFSCQPAVWGSG